MNVEFAFDDGTFRHFMNGHLAVMHCHHYMALTVKVATQFRDCGGEQLLCESTEDAMRPLLDDYFRKHGTPVGEERLKIASDYYSVMGLGKLSLTGDVTGGEVTLMRSHVDEGWVKKFGTAPGPINFVTCGYAAAAFAAAFEKPPRTYGAKEVSSMAMGASQGKMLISEGGLS